jgi:MFS family permease
MTNTSSRSMIAFIWHGAFLALTMAMLDLNTVFPTLIRTLSANRLVFGALYSILLGAPLLFNVIFSHLLRKKPYKKPYLFLGIVVRSLSFFAMAVVTYLFGTERPDLVVASFFVLVFLFSVSGGFAGLSYSDLLAKTIPSTRRTTLFTVKQLFGSLASLLGGFIIARIFRDTIGFPGNYAIGLVIGGVGLLVASLGFLFVDEPRTTLDEQENTSLITYIKRIPSVFRTDASFRYFVLVENLSAAGIMILPFYILYVMEVRSLEDEWIGLYLLLQIGGTILSNLLWGWIGRRYMAKAVVRVCILLGAITPVLALLLVHVSAAAYGMVFLLMGFMISGRRIGFEPTLLDLAPPSFRMDYLGIRGTLNLLVVILPLSGALFIEWLGYPITFGLVSALLLIAGLLSTKVTSAQYEEAACI